MKNLKKMVILSNLLAMAIILSIIEGFYPIIPVPSAKIGFANIVTLLILYIYGSKEAFLITILRIILVALLSGKSFSITFLMGLSGGILSVLIMSLIKILKFHMVTVSILGSVFHAIGQILMGMFLLSTETLYLYLPIMLLTSIPAGILVGIIGNQLLKMDMLQNIIK